MINIKVFIPVVLICCLLSGIAPGTMLGAEYLFNVDAKLQQAVDAWGKLLANYRGLVHHHTYVFVL